ncbi:MAG: hypothetical protein JWO78_2053 [Micavibrio sp.]|nr:hypothetical protein [Micavibrio sp.]
MNLKVAGFTALTLGVLGFFMADGIPKHGVASTGTFSKKACLSSIEKHSSKDMFTKDTANGLCGCLADLGLTRETADFKTVKSCLDKHLGGTIINACEKDEAARQAARDRPKSPEDEMRDDSNVFGPSMNCSCVSEKSEEWVWKNFEAGMRSRVMKNEEANDFATSMMNECKWK